MPQDGRLVVPHRGNGITRRQNISGTRSLMGSVSFLFYFIFIYLKFNLGKYFSDCFKKNWVSDPKRFQNQATLSTCTAGSLLFQPNNWCSREIQVVNKFIFSLSIRKLRQTLEDHFFVVKNLTFNDSQST